MKIEVQGPASLVAKRLEQHVRRRVQFALGGFPGRVRAVIVQFSYPVPETGEPRTRCAIEVTLRPLTVRAEDIDADHYLAADKAADRLQRALERALAHERAWKEAPGTPRMLATKPEPKPKPKPKTEPNPKPNRKLTAKPKLKPTPTGTQRKEAIAKAEPLAAHPKRRAAKPTRPRPATGR